MAINTLFFDFAVRHSWHRISRMYNQKALELGITVPIGFILMSVDIEGTPSTQLGPKMGMEATSLSRTIKTMEDRKLIFRIEDTVDKRKVLVHLTEEGVKMRKKIKQMIVEFNELIRTKVSKKKLEQFFEVIEKVDLLIEKEIKKKH